MKDVPDELLKQFIEACHDAARRGLVRCSSGNMSLRIGEDRMLVTATRSWMGRLSAEDVVVCSIGEQRALNGIKPSAEIGIHAGILEARPDVNVAMHFQTPFASTLACRKVEDINYYVIPEIPFYIGPVAQIPYFSPGSKELAEAVTEAMREHDMVVMSNHGQATVARDFDHAIQNAEFFELACQIIVQGAGKVTPMCSDAAEQLLAMRRDASSSGA